MADLKCLASMLNSISIMGIIYEGWDDWSVFSESKPRCDWYLCEWHEGYRFTRSTCFPSSFLLALRCVLVLFCPPTPSLPLQRCTECCRKAQECHCVGYQRESESVQPIPLKLTLHIDSRQGLLNSGILQRSCSRGHSPLGTTIIQYLACCPWPFVTKQKKKHQHIISCWESHGLFNTTFAWPFRNNVICPWFIRESVDGASPAEDLEDQLLAYSHLYSPRGKLFLTLCFVVHAEWKWSDSRTFMSHLSTQKGHLVFQH